MSQVNQVLMFSQNSKTPFVPGCSLCLDFIDIDLLPDLNIWGSECSHWCNGATSCARRADLRADHASLSFLGVHRCVVEWHCVITMLWWTCDMFQHLSCLSARRLLFLSVLEQSVEKLTYAILHDLRLPLSLVSSSPLNWHATHKCSWQQTSLTLSA